jgi:tetratricopeptide (TPR) repeat protein
MSAVSEIDDKTAAAIREAMRAAGTGRTADAIRIGEQALAGGGNQAALNAMLGTLHCRSGNLEAGVERLAAAQRERPDDLVIVRNLTTALAELGREQEAFDLLTEEVAAKDETQFLMRLRGFLAQNLEQYQAASEAYRRVIASSPDDWESWNNLGNARRQLGDLDGSLDALRRSVELNPRSAPSRLNYATALEQAGDLDAAERELRNMAADFPTDERSMRTLFTLLKSQNRIEEAIAAIEEAARRAPNDIELLLGLASERFNQRQHSAAEEAYRRAIAIDPKNVLAFLGVATVLDQTNRTEELATFVAEAEAADLPAAGLSFVKAFDHRRARRFQEGLDALSQVPEGIETARRQQLLGQLLEGVGRFDEAFEAFERCNSISSEDPSDPLGRGAAYRDKVRNERDRLSEEWVESWARAEVDARPSPVFLVGFPRSGTTLLDTILMAHPRTEVLEEEPALTRAVDTLGGFEAIQSASSEDIKRARNTYFNIAGSLTALKPGKLLIDKNPLSMNSVPAIRRLFPDARIILALRHPCDVVLSCFATNFALNNAMASFLSLDTTAELYDLSFSSFEKASALLKAPVHQLVYERLIEDQDRELRPLLEFLGLEWDVRLLDHQSTAKQRGHIKTASYAQVVEPIYTRSAGRWLNYRKHLEPVIPALRPWIEKFGYEI